MKQKSDAATTEALQVAQNLPDTSTARKDNCVGMVANMIGVRKRYQSIIRPWSCKPVSRPTPAGQPGSSGTNWFLAMARRYEPAAKLFPDDMDGHIAYKAPCIEDLYRRCGLE